MGQTSPSGILNLDKPAGWTSHDVVAQVRRITGQKRVGHAGTLDPMATGVLLLCVGQATRLAEYLMQSTKVYQARVRLGVSTDTYDAEGRVVATSNDIPTDRAIVERALLQFVGVIEQVPPMFSAIKHQGQPLYARARRGEAMEVAARPVHVHEIQLTEWMPPELEFTVTCGKGTYVRSLAHDLGQALGCGAHLVALRRLSVGSFRAEDAVTLAELEDAAEKGHWTKLLVPMDEAVKQYPAVVLSENDFARVIHGQQITLPVPVQGVLCRAYSPDGNFVALLAQDQAIDLWHPQKVFWPK
ncbi:MAG: tRNA pseudouridine(55) synthase TruB [Chloroflexi bacterium]|nr:tRNA pseudouridine(55) synthase TruB [Chloroflexota bacterium]